MQNASRIFQEILLKILWNIYLNSEIIDYIIIIDKKSNQTIKI